MAIKVISNYAKRLGLPGYSSHQFSVSVETELSDPEQISAEVSRLYHDLQEAVDREIQITGFVPGDEYGKRNTQDIPVNGSRGSNGNTPPPGNGTHRQEPERWNCSDKQKQLIQKLVGENDLDRNAVEQTALERFGVGVRMLNKLQASGLISELLEFCSRKQPVNGSGKQGGQR